MTPATIACDVPMHGYALMLTSLILKGSRIGSISKVRSAPERNALSRPPLPSKIDSGPVVPRDASKLQSVPWQATKAVDIALEFESCPERTADRVFPWAADSAIALASWSGSNFRRRPAIAGAAKADAVT